MRLVILDRDGVINQDSDSYIKSVDEWHAIPGSLEAIARLVRAEYQVVVVSNQSGIARGLFNFDTLNKIHNHMLEQIHHKGGEIDAIFFCPHGPDDGCHCRKPLPGLFIELAERLNAELGGVVTVGDSMRDLVAAAAVGARPFLVGTGKGERTLLEVEQAGWPQGLEATPIYDDLSAAVSAILAEDSNKPDTSAQH